MMAGIAALCKKPPLFSKYQRVSQRHAYLAENLAPVACRALAALGAGAPSVSLVEFLAVIERAERSVYRNDDEPTLSALVRGNPSIQQSLLWHDVADVRASGREVTSAWQVFFGGNHLWHLGASDLVWLFDDLANRPLRDDRRVALSAILSILHAEKTLGNRPGPCGGE